MNQRLDDRVQNMTPEQIEEKRRSYRVENMTPDRIEARRAAQRYVNMPAERVERYRARDICRTRKKYKSNLEQAWDFEHPCAHCGLVWLKQATYERTYVIYVYYYVISL